MKALLVCGLALSLVGCVSSGDIALLHREITDVSRQVEDLGRQSSGKADVRAMSQKLAEQNAQLLKSNADIQLELQKLRDQLEGLQANLETSNQRLEAVSQELAAARDRVGGGGNLTAPPQTAGGVGGAPAATAGAAGRPSEPAQLYNSAYEDFLRGNFDLSIQGFRDYVNKYPKEPLAGNALYWIGECYYSKRQFPEAISAFTELLNGYKISDKAAAALLKRGLAYLEAGDRTQAVINLQYVIYEHPGTKEADLARSRLAALGVKVK